MSDSLPIETIEIEINGQKLQAPQGSMIIEVADNAGIKIPRFCYHKKLSVAANCRMCLVQVEKAPKPLPACATPVTPGMKVFTESPVAKEAQQSVMEFLLINHPLDCPICDQGGSCELQDVSLTYGNDFSRYEEARRSVKDENLGSLIATEMTRCIQCTRCVRFGQEIAGVRELGTLGRGDRMEIGSYLKNHALTSEISGNIIDLCPVGALTSRPFRFSARAWELKQAETIAAHDALGANVYLHVRNNKVMRVVPKENETVNETWISDRDRFSYEGLNAKDRLTVPMIKQNNVWKEIDWVTAINTVQQNLNKHVSPSTQIAAIISPNATYEESYLLQKWMRDLGTQHIDHRLHETDADTDQSAMPLYPNLGIKIANLQEQELIVIIGSCIHYENPLIANRIRKANLQGAKILCINPADFNFAFSVADKKITSPQEMCAVLAQDDLWENYFNDVSQSHKKIILLGEIAFNHPNASLIRYHAKRLSEKYQASIGYVTAGANSAGAWLAGAVPHRKPMGELAPAGGYTVAKALQAKLSSYVLFNIDPLIDLAQPELAYSAFQHADNVIAFSAFKTPGLLETATLLLPIAVFAENSGTYINLEGTFQTFNAAVNPPGESRPAWKIVRVLGDFSYQTLEEIQAELKHLFEHKHVFHSLDISYTKNSAQRSSLDDTKLTQIKTWAPYQSDMLVRHSQSLQNSPLSNALNVIKLHENTLKKYQSEITTWNQILLDAIHIDNSIAEDCIFMPASLQTILIRKEK